MLGSGKGGNPVSGTVLLIKSIELICLTTMMMKAEMEAEAMMLLLLLLLLRGCGWLKYSYVD